jgi:hypothetical protein
MRYFVWLICFALLSSPQVARANDDLKHKIIGVWKLESFFVESVETKERHKPYGEAPNGYLIITPDRFTALITGQVRKAAQTDEERAALLRTMFAYTGLYKLEGDRLTTKVDVSWNEIWVGTDQERIFRFEGDKLVAESLPAPGANQQVPGLVKGILTFTRSK